MTVRGGRVLLLRHTAVSARWAGRCYGNTDVPLGRDGLRAARALAASLGAERFDLVVTSPLRRARFLAGLLARPRGMPLAVEDRLRERHFGDWEGAAWDAVWRRVGAAMEGMLTHPDSYRPGGGETTAELLARAKSWLAGLPPGISVAAVAHGGPIGALVGDLLGLEPARWLTAVPRCGEGFLLEAGGARGVALTPFPAALAGPRRRC